MGGGLKKGSETVGSDRFSGRSFKDFLALLAICVAADSSTIHDSQLQIICWPKNRGYNPFILFPGYSPAGCLISGCLGMGTQ